MEENNTLHNKSTGGTLPLIPLRGLVMFPEMMLHFDAGREKSIAALNYAMNHNKEILLVCQRDIRDEDPDFSRIYDFGCTAKIRQLFKVNDSEVRVLVEGLKRVYINDVTEAKSFNIGTYFAAEEKSCEKDELYLEASLRHAKALFEEYAALSVRIPTNVVLSISAADKIDYFSDYVAANLPFQVEDKQLVLEELDPVKRIELVCEIFEREIQILSIDARIAEKVKVQMDDNQRDYYLREQLKALNDELYGESDPREEANELREKINKLSASNEVKQKLLKEAEKLEHMPFGSQEASVIRNYLDVCTELPWGKYSVDNMSLKESKEILEREHYGLEKVKQRIIESLAVTHLTGTVSGSILCLVGPPGVGKTSIARSVANCMDRRFARISLGGVHDEAEIRGHRRTYVGAMPGRIIDAVKSAGTCNPVILLDEIDKIGSDYKGDPASALLEALDPEQNSTFKDHFVDMPYDLSNVMFLTTANSMDTIPAPLLDRMEIIEIAGYTREDKFRIAKKYLVKKQLEKNGLTPSVCKITDSAIHHMIDDYTREAGVRKLEQKIAAVCRGVAAKVVGEECKTVSVNAGSLKEYLGNPRYKDDGLLPSDEVGVVNGLAWTQVGGTLLQLEASVLDGSGTVELTGSLGDVMKESAACALSYVRSIADIAGIEPDFYKNSDFHINATETAVPKDGPSAGITMVTALVSALTGVPVRRDVAMTGEITLRGRILPIGGLREKSMAAYSAGVKTVFFPKANVLDLDDVDPIVKQAVEFIPVSTADEVLSAALVGGMPRKKEKSETVPVSKNTDRKPSARQ